MQLTISKELFGDVVKYSHDNSIHYKKLIAELVKVGFSGITQGTLCVRTSDGVTDLDLDLSSLKVEEVDAVSTTE